MTCDLIPVLMLVDQTESSHKVGLRVRVELQQARWLLPIVHLLTGLTIVQDDVVRLIPVNQDHIRSEVGSEVVALN